MFDKTCRKNQKAHFMLSNFPKIVLFMR